MEEYYISPNEYRDRAKSDSQAIQMAVDAAAESLGGSRVVRIPRRCQRTGLDVWNIDRTILLPSDITILLDDCRLRLADGVYQNIFRNKNVYTPEGSTTDGEQYGIRIIGIGNAVLDGGEPNDLNESTSDTNGLPNIRFNNLILLHNVRNYEMRDFSCVNMRWWAINQIFCRHGILQNLKFWNGEHLRNRDGINLRIGCSDITIDNIRGRTGDDVVALTALPLGGDRRFAIEGRDPDIHDVAIRNVYAHTRQSVVALRNCDGAQMYRITIENIADIGGEYGPWGVVRIGENNYYRQRPALLGETREIRVRGVHSLCRGTVFLAAGLQDSHISDVFAGGSSMHAVSTFAPDVRSSETGCLIRGGVSMKNVVIDNIHYNGTADHRDDTSVTLPDSDFAGAALDFRCIRETDTFQNVIFRDIFSCDGKKLAVVNPNISLDIR